MTKMIRNAYKTTSTALQNTHKWTQISRLLYDIVRQQHDNNTMALFCTVFDTLDIENNTATLKSGPGVETGSIRSPAYGFLLASCSNFVFKV